MSQFTFSDQVYVFAEGRSRTGNVARLMWSRTTRAITSLCRLVTSAYVNKAH